ncbi:DNA translocase FtsK [Candidatus Gottesmanbacteria bacterium]|nr:DNA translocase FtsK [Candidatus Gottesmanbacteria bacterium]
MKRSFFGGGKRRYKRHSTFRFKLKQQTVYTVGAIWLWLFAAVITVSFFGEGAVLVALRDALVVHLGWIMYLTPPFLVSLSFLFFKVKSDIGRPNVPLGIGIMLVALATLTQSGDVGVLLWSLLSGAIAAEGTVVVALGLFMISLIVLFNTSLDRFMNFLFMGAQALWEWANAGLERMTGRRDRAIFGREDKPILKIKGVDDAKPFMKAPISPPPIPAAEKAAAHGVKSELKIQSPMSNAPSTDGTAIWEYPPLSLLSDGPGGKADRGDVRDNAQVIEKTLDGFGIKADVVEVNKGPAVTQYALEIALGTKVSKITALSSDLALALAAPTGQVRIEAPIPGKKLVGIEIPNRGLEFVTLKNMLGSEVMRKAKSKLTVALGLDVSGSAVTGDIGKMPHVLIAGTTGSGKSVLINSWICSLLFRTTPQEVRLIMVDPKRVELTGYNGIPHLLTPVIVEPDKILSSLRWAMGEMENRYKQFAEVGVRNIDSFNDLSGFQAMPYIVIIIDELADLMAYAPVEVEDSICRIAQMARATGIHLVLATQRPSVDVITGLIKANVPARIAFSVSSMIDSRVVIDMPGAEKLLGKGDMLYVPPDQAKPSRIQGTFVSEQEVSKLVEFLRSKNMPVQYTEEVTSLSVPVGGKKGAVGTSGGDGHDHLFEDAIRLVCQHDKASASLLQRRLSIGYARAARILDQLEESGIIGPGEGSKPRDVLMKNAEEYLAQQQTQS